MTQRLLAISIIALGASAPAALGGTPAPQQAQVVEIAPLFEYPMAPDDLTSIDDKSAWLMHHFWDSFDFKRKEAVDQTALNHAFQVYSTPMRWAPRQDVDDALAALLKKLDKNPTLLYQFTKAAEENLYGPRADMWIDEVYIQFLRAAVRHKKISEPRKARFADQLARLEATQPGQTAPGFDFTDIYGNEARYFPMATYTIIEFGDPDCDECRMSSLKLEANAALNALVTQGKVNILFIVPDADESWTAKVGTMSRKWTVGASDNAADRYDIRATPSIYVVGSDGKIVMKNVTVQAAIDAALSNFDNNN